MFVVAQLHSMAAREHLVRAVAIAQLVTQALGCFRPGVLFALPDGVRSDSASGSGGDAA